MAVAAAVTGRTFQPGTPEALFQTHPVQAGIKPQYDVAHDGRILIDTELQDVSAEPIHVLLNWNPEAKSSRPS